MWFLLLLFAFVFFSTQDLASFSSLLLHSLLTTSKIRPEFRAYVIQGLGPGALCLEVGVQALGFKVGGFRALSLGFQGLGFR